MSENEKKCGSVCSVCYKPTNSRCSACKKIYYCSLSCQKQMWTTHKSVCNKDSRLLTLLIKSYHAFPHEIICCLMEEKGYADMYQAIIDHWSDEQCAILHKWKEVQCQLVTSPKRPSNDPAIVFLQAMDDFKKDIIGFFEANGRKADAGLMNQTAEFMTVIRSLKKEQQLDIDTSELDALKDIYSLGCMGLMSLIAYLTNSVFAKRFTVYLSQFFRKNKPSYSTDMLTNVTKRSSIQDIVFCKNQYANKYVFHSATIQYDDAHFHSFGIFQIPTDSTPLYSIVQSYGRTFNFHDWIENNAKCSSPFTDCLTFESVVFFLACVQVMTNKHTPLWFSESLHETCFGMKLPKCSKSHPRHLLLTSDIFELSDFRKNLNDLLT